MNEGTIFAWIGIFFVSVVILVLVRQDSLLFFRPWKLVFGKVLGHVKSTDDGGEYFSVKVQFELSDGNPVVFVDDYGSLKMHPPVGSLVRVIYPVEKPDQAKVFRPGLRMFMYFSLIAMLAVLLVRTLDFSSVSG